MNCQSEITRIGWKSDRKQKGEDCFFLKTWTNPLKGETAELHSSSQQPVRADCEDV